MVTISSLHVDLIFQILNKMEAVPLVRMRQTCKTVNYVAQNNGKKLAVRPSLGTSFHLHYSTHEDQEDFYFGKTPYSEVQVKVVPGGYEKYLSGISFKTIYLDISDNVHLQAIEFLERLQPKCEKLCMTAFPLNLIGRLTSCVTFEDNLRLKISNYEGHSAEKVLSILEKAPNHSKFLVFFLPGVVEFTGVFAKVKIFAGIKCNIAYGAFVELVWDLQKSKERITMESMYLKIRTNGSWLDEQLPLFQELPKHWKMIEESGKVRLLELPLQYALLSVEHVDTRAQCTNLVIDFMEKDDQIFEKKLFSIFGQPPIPPKPEYSKNFRCLVRLADSLIFHVLNKLNVEVIINMRKTCSKIHKIAVAYGKKLASRPALGMTIEVTLWADGDLEFGDKNHIYQVVEMMSELRPVCNRIQAWRFPLDLIVPLTDAITFKEVFDFEDNMISINDHDQETVLSALSKGRNCSKFSFTCSHMMSEKIFDKIKRFYAVTLETDQKRFDELLWNIQNCKERITIKQIIVDIEGSDLFENPMLPPMKSLHEPGSKYDCTRLMTLPSQFAHISGGNGGSTRVWINFMKKSSFKLGNTIIEE